MKLISNSYVSATVCFPLLLCKPHRVLSKVIHSAVIGTVYQVSTKTVVYSNSLVTQS
jgi:hypothetical protein